MAQQVAAHGGVFESTVKMWEDELEALKPFAMRSDTGTSQTLLSSIPIHHQTNTPRLLPLLPSRLPTRNPRLLLPQPPLPPSSQPFKHSPCLFYSQNPPHHSPNPRPHHQIPLPRPQLGLPHRRRRRLHRHLNATLNSRTTGRNQRGSQRHRLANQHRRPGLLCTGRRLASTWCDYHGYLLGGATSAAQV